MKTYPIEPGKHKYTLSDLENNEIITTDPQMVISEMWAKGWPVPTISVMYNAIRHMSNGDMILLEDVGVTIRKHYAIV